MKVREIKSPEEKLILFRKKFPSGGLKLIPFTPEQEIEGAKIFGAEVQIFSGAGVMIANAYETLTVFGGCVSDDEINNLYERALDLALTFAGFGYEVEL